MIDNKKSEYSRQINTT